MSSVLFSDFYQFLKVDLGCVLLKITLVKQPPGYFPSLGVCTQVCTHTLGWWTCAQSSIVLPETVPSGQNGLSGLKVAKCGNWQEETVSEDGNRAASSHLLFLWHMQEGEFVTLEGPWSLLTVAQPTVCSTPGGILPCSDLGTVSSQ